MSLYSAEQKEKEAKQRARYLALQQAREQAMTRKLQKIQRKVVRVGGLDINFMIRRSLTVQNSARMALVRQRIKFAMLIRRALRTAGIYMPSFRGIPLTRAMRRLIARIRRRKIDRWMFELRAQWLNREMAMARSGKSVDSRFAGLIDKGIGKLNEMRRSVSEARDAAASQHNDYCEDRLNHRYMQIISGRNAARSLYNGHSK